LISQVDLGAGTGLVGSVLAPAALKGKGAVAADATEAATRIPAAAIERVPQATDAPVNYGAQRALASKGSLQGGVNPSTVASTRRSQLTG